ncbi:hypothetical protein SSS_10907 [Sarcoptes scabiei]|nr:hypothetical protein SSS_10907 [Sarcoptes scabiei]
MYGLYLKYFHKDKNDDPTPEQLRNKLDQEAKIRLAEERFRFNLRKESKPFQMSFITSAGTMAGILAFVIIYPIKNSKQLNFTVSSIEKIVKPFCWTAFTSFASSLAFSIGYILWPNEPRIK